MIKAVVTEYVERNEDEKTQYDFFKKFETKEEGMKLFKLGGYKKTDKVGYDLEKSEYDSDIDKYWNIFVKFEEITD